MRKRRARIHGPGEGGEGGEGVGGGWCEVSRVVCGVGGLSKLFYPLFSDDKSMSVKLGATRKPEPED